MRTILCVSLVLSSMLGGGAGPTASAVTSGSDLSDPHERIVTRRPVRELGRRAGLRNVAQRGRQVRRTGSRPTRNAARGAPWC